jgi:hypothetical protein
MNGNNPMIRLIVDLSTKINERHHYRQKPMSKKSYKFYHEVGESNFDLLKVELRMVFQEEWDDERRDLEDEIIPFNGFEDKVVLNLR